MARTVKRAALAAMTLLLVSGIAIYAISKPYQQDRILISLGLKTIN
ncbi:MAG: hypothetical protein J7494_08625 [Sphingobium sp.]|nr:hypothetical protein [Sphingobium sp.]